MGGGDDEPTGGKLMTLMTKSIVFVLLSAQLAMAQAPQAGDMVEIPAGAFTMGSDSGPNDERPAHSVTLPRFFIDRLPVTNAQFAEFLNAKGRMSARREVYYQDDDSDARIHQKAGRWAADPGSEKHPVLEVSWIGARDYCSWAGKRLPTEAEWEKAARGTDRRRYPWGNDLPDRNRAQFNAGWTGTTNAGSFPKGASPYGVLDLAGNAWEWVSSAYRPYPYSASDGRENLEPGPVRSTRGGGQDSPAEEITTTQRGRNLSREPGGGHHNIGFRCAR
jgi:formylglycine-generating enzyme required for sulfatase activity